MIFSRLSKLSALGLFVFSAHLGSHFERNASSPPQNPSPALINTCLITKDVAGLAQFYSEVLQISPKKTATEYAEFPTGVGVLAIFSAGAQEKYIPHSAEPGNNRSAILEFSVSDVDQEYSRLQTIVKSWVKPPTTQPWGTRSIYFRDPDGNLIDFFARASAMGKTRVTPLEK